MNLITYLLTRESSGAAVTDLQDALRLFLQNGISMIEEEDLRFYLDTLREERTAERYGDVTHKLVGIFQTLNRLPSTGDVDRPTAEAINAALAEFITVQGRVVDPHGKPLARYRVRMSEYDLQGATEIRSVDTNADGAFELVFRRDGALRAGDDTTSADLLFQVFDPEEVERIIMSISVARDETHGDVPRLAESQHAPIVLMNVAGELAVRIVVNATRRASTEFEQLVARLTPFMGHTAFAELAEDERRFQISFLARETGVPRAKIEQLRSAFRQERIAAGVPAWAFFGLASEETELAGLAYLPEEELARILEPLQPQRDGAEIRTVARSLLQFLRQRDLDNKAAALHEAVGGWMTRVLGSEEKTAAFLKAYVRHEGDRAAFWRRMEENPDFAEAVPRLQLDAQLAQITLRNTGLADALRERGIKNTRQLVDVARETWETLAYEHRAGIPAHIAGEDERARARVYAQEMQQVVELAFPTAVIRKTIQDPVLATFLDRNPDFDLTQSPVERYLRERGEAALEGIEQPDAFTTRLRRTQRLYTVTANAADTQTLMELDFESAHAIARMPLDDFARRVEGRIAPEKVHPYYTKAVSVTEASTMFYHWLRDLSTSPAPKAAGGAGGAPEVRDALPDWQSLFGPLSLCGCEHCRSVYSPAAYFVDLLHILLGQNKGVARAELFRRRPDLLYTNLSCEHTETLIPYIDLVNEILETFVAQSNVGSPSARSHAQLATNDTSAFSTSDLLANPQHPNPASAKDAADAYALLANAKYPLTLPFDMNLETARQFLQEQASSRAEVMAVFGDAGSYAALAERLAISEGEFEALTLKKLDGVTAAGVNVAADLWGGPAIPAGQTLGQALTRADVFLERAGIAAEDLFGLLATRTLNPHHPINVFLQALPPAQRAAWLADHPEEDALAQTVIELGADINDPCNLAKSEIRHLNGQYLTDEEMSLFNRFIRLWKRLGCPIRELDALLTSLKAADITPEAVRDLSHLWRAQTSLQLPLETLAALAGDIPTTGPGSLYARLFLNKAILQIDSGFMLNSAQTELANSADDLGKHVPALLAAFQISEEELNGIAEYAGLDPASDDMNLANLSRLYRHVILARGLGMKVKALVKWLKLFGAAPWADAAGLLDALGGLLKVQRYDFAAADFAYIFLDERAPGHALPPTGEVIARSATTLGAGLAKITQEHTPKDGVVTADFLRTELGILLEPEELSRIVGILDGSNAGDPFTDLPNPQALEAYKEVLKGYLSAADAADLAATADISQRQQKYWGKLESKLLPALRRTFIQQHLAAAFKAEPALVTLMLGDPAVLAACLGTEAGGPAAMKAYAEQYEWMHKFAWLAGKLELGPAELTFFQGNPDFANFDWKDFDFAAWLRLADTVALRDGLPPGEGDLLAVFQAASSGGDIPAAIVAASGWDEANVRYFVAARGAAALRNEIALTELRRQMAMSEQIGVSIANLEGWATATVSHDRARDVKRTLKAKYDEVAWIEVSSNVHNRIRTRLRDALVAYLLQKPEIVALELKDPNDLFGYFLIDVQMDACMQTSRLKQAISSVQTFVQRCLLDLEAPAVTPNLIDARQWKWMQNYRVWEANRKVFLYPENWIEPELRDNKSPFFKELETELLQAEITNEAAEQALVNYLEKLDEVARLDVCATCSDHEGQELHVFARSFNTPPQYFYRTLDLEAQVWTAWQRVPLDIQGTEEGDSTGAHLIPVVFNRRLYLFWGLFAEKPDKDKRDADKQEYKKQKEAHDSWWSQVSALRRKKAELKEQGLGNTTDESMYGPMPVVPDVEEYPWAYYEVRLAWSEYRGNKWSNKRVSQSFVRTDSNRYGVSETWGYRFTIRTGKTLTLALSHLPGGYADPIGEFQFNCNGRIRTMDTQDNAYLLEVIRPKQAGYYQGLLSANTTNRKIAWHKDASLPLSLSMDNGKGTLDVLAGSEREYKLVFTGDGTFSAYKSADFFYQDARRSYYVEYEYDWAKERFASVVDPYRAELPPAKNQLPPGPQNANRMGRWEIEGMRRFKQAGPKMLSELVAGQQITTSASLKILAQKSWAEASVSEALEAGPGAYVAELANSYYLSPTSKRRLRFKPFFHAWACRFMEELNRGGIDGLLNIYNQQLTDAELLPVAGGGAPVIATNFKYLYMPLNVAPPYPVEEVDFSNGGAYSSYNWELFFHIPVLIANRLSKNRRHEEAMRWYHFVFNPTTHEKLNTSARYWQVIPFRNTPTETLEALMMQLQNPAGDPKRKELEEAIAAWRKSPFNPHLIARMRLIAYQKNTVMKYLDNLIDWADGLFRQDTIEAINQATQLYIVAAQVCGRRPEVLPARGEVEALNYAEMETAGLDAFSNALVKLETVFPFYNITPPGPGLGGAAALLNTSTPSLYFCLPYNEKLLGYWDTIADRLFKIRHCQSIEGVERQLALFEPPIDPALLVRAVAGGLDISSVLADLNSPPPHYRFGYIVQKALEICSQLQVLGKDLLSALEKRDAERLALMRSEDETSLLRLAKGVRKLQVADAQRSLEGLEKAREVVESRIDYYSRLAQDGLIAGEKAQQALSGVSMVLSLAGQFLEAASSSANSEPDWYEGVLAGPAGGNIKLFYMGGGDKTAASLSASGRFFQMASTMTSWAAGVAQASAGYDRRSTDWRFQAELARKELAQVDKQILAAQIREQLAEKEMEAHEKQLENAQQVDEFLRSKYTQEELYGWMVGELSSIYFQCYQLAYDIAKKAEKAYRHELGVRDSSFIQFGIWDSFRKGLLAGDRLYLSLKQMEKSYVDLNRREYELTKQVSLLQLAPMALIQLKELGTCTVELPEMLFDADYAGHYMRRIKGVSLTIPSVAGPYNNVNCILTLLKSQTRVSAVDAGTYAADMTTENPRVVTNYAAAESIATSSGQNDSGTFEFNFRDERYLPFEGSGAVSRWRIDLPQEFRAFDYDTISDVVLTVRYTSRRGSAALQEAAGDALRKALRAETTAPQVRLFSLRHEFPSEWSRLLRVADDNGDHRQAFSLNKGRFPFMFGGSKVTITKVELLGVPAGTAAPGMKLALADPSGQAVNVQPNPAVGRLAHRSAPASVEVKPLGEDGHEADWTIEVKKADVAGSLKVLRDLLVLCEYSVLQV